MAGVTGINHIAFAVKNLKESLDNATEVLGGEIMMKFESIEDKYEGACVKFGSSIMSFITSHDPDSFIYKFVEKHGNGVQHIGLEIDDIEIYQMRTEGDTQIKLKFIEKDGQELERVLNISSHKSESVIQANFFNNRLYLRW